jgi:hypothetical protein
LAPGARGSAERVADGIAVMEAFGRRCCYGLGDVFVDDEPLARLGWASLVAAVRVARPVAVLVPDVDGLRLSGTELEVLRVRLRRSTSAPLVVARADVAWGVPDLGSPVRAGAPVGDAVLPLAVRSPVPARMVGARRARSRRVAWGLSWGR